MRIPRHLSLGLCALALAWCAARSQAGPITFISQDRSVQGIATIGTATDADLKNSTDPGRFDQTAAKTLSAGGTQASASASQQSFIDPDRLGSSGQLALALVNPSQGDSAEAHSRFLTSFQVNEPVLFSLRANMSGSLEFNGALRLGRSDLASFIIDTSLTPQQPDFSLDSQLGAGLYQLHFEPTAKVSGAAVDGTAPYSLFLETSPAAVIPLPPALWTALAPLALIFGITLKSSRMRNAMLRL